MPNQYPHRGLRDRLDRLAGRQPLDEVSTCRADRGYRRYVSGGREEAPAAGQKARQTAARRLARLARKTAKHSTNICGAQPVRKSDTLKTIYICQIGDFTAEQKKIIDCTREYLEIYFATPVKIRKTLALADIPEGETHAPEVGRQADSEHVRPRRSASARSPRRCARLSRVHSQRSLARRGVELRLWPGEPARADRRLVDLPQWRPHQGRRRIPPVSSPHARHRHARDRPHPDHAALHRL